MSLEEVANAEALRRIREAENTGAISLDLSHINFLYQLPQELERPTSLRTLNLSQCCQLSDLAPLAGLSSLQELDISNCLQLSDLGSLTGLTSLRTIDLSQCWQLRELILPTGLRSLQTLKLTWCCITPHFPEAALQILYLIDLVYELVYERNRQPASKTKN